MRRRDSIRERNANADGTTTLTDLTEPTTLTTPTEPTIPTTLTEPTIPTTPTTPTDPTQLRERSAAETAGRRDRPGQRRAKPAGFRPLREARLA